MTTEVDLQELLDTLTDATKTELACTPTVEDWNGSLDVASLPIKARKWIKVPDIVAVVADLKNSTKLGTGKWAASTAASTKPPLVASLTRLSSSTRISSRFRAAAPLHCFGGTGDTSGPCAPRSPSGPLATTSFSVLSPSG